MSDTTSLHTMRKAALMVAFVSYLAAPALAQSSDAGAAPEPVEAHTAAATDPNAETAPAQPAAAPSAANNGFPKALSPQQRLPENLQGWLRSRRHPAVAERPPSAPSTLAPQITAANEEQAIEGYKRRLRSFDEGGVTVLSNRHAPAPAPARVAATAAVAVAATVPAPRLEEEPEPEAPSVTETRSLRAKQLKAKAPLPDQGLSWPRFAVPIAAIGLGLIWLRRRRQAG